MTNEERRKALVQQAQSLYNSGRSAEAVAPLLTCLDLFGPGERDGLEFADFSLVLGSAYAESGRLKPALESFEAARSIYYERPGEEGNAALACFNMGNVYNYANIRQGAHDCYSQAIRLSGSAGRPELTARCLLGMLHLYKALGVTDLKVLGPYLEKFEAVRAAASDDPEILRSYLALRAWIESETGKGVEALATARDALEQAKRSGNAAVVADAESMLARVLREAGRLAEAAEPTRRAHEAMKSLGDRRVVETAFGQAELFEAKGDLDSADRAFAEYVDLIDLQRSELDGPERYNFMDREAPRVRRYVAFAARAGRAGQAFEVTERVQSRTIHDLMFRHLVKRQAGRSVRVGLRGRVELPPPTLAEAAEATRREGVHFVKFLRDVDVKLRGWLLDPDGELRTWDASEAEGPAGEVIGRLLASPLVPNVRPSAERKLSVELPPGDAGNDGSWSGIQALLTRLYLALFPDDVRQRLETQSGKLVIAPDSVHYFLPLAALGTADGWCLCDSWQVAVVPSLGTFLQLDRRRDPEATPSDPGGPVRAVVAGGCGDQTVTQPVVPNDDRTATLSFQDLPGAVNEVSWVAGFLGQPGLLGPDASPANVVAGFAGADLMHFATHGHWDIIAPERSFLLLAGGVLSSAAVLESETRAELVVLSGCQTGLGLPHPDSFVGLAQSFLIAGARTVMVSLWPIGDGPTVRFMRCFYGHLRGGGQTVAEALQSTQREFRRGPNPEDGRVWAAFQLVGRPFSGLQPGPAPDPFGGPVFRGGDVHSDATPGELVPADRL